MRRLGLLLIAMLVFTTACNSASDTPRGESHSSSVKAVHLSKEPVELEFWSYYGGWEPIIEAFQKKYPNVTVRLKTFSNDSYVGPYHRAIAKGDTPDVMIADSEEFGSFTGIAGLEDLFEFGAEKYRDDFSESLWASNLSFDRKSLIGFPSGSSPLVTYYRADIMEQHGFPSEPEELAEFMESPENWIAIARKLKERDSYIASWPMDVIQLFDSTQGLFDYKMGFARDTAASKKGVNIAKTMYNENLVSSNDVWTQSGIEGIRTGKFAMLYMGTWGANQIAQWAPGTTGLWRQTRLPFNLYGWANSSSFMIPSAADQKEWAYLFIEFCVTEWSMKGSGNGVPSYLPARAQQVSDGKSNAFYGGQNLYALNEKLTDRMREYSATPVDAQARAIWSKVINSGIERNREAESIIQEAEREIFTTLGKEIHILENYLLQNHLIVQ
ncbi:ABC transporter substrate-binding protein [Paenibacillus sp. GCM10027627]|uniref:ABC transporter substrate-binding protein n=1 Tax=unclassified Paenibacillus TaxID=185978 RepID=UPI00362CA776